MQKFILNNRRWLKSAMLTLVVVCPFMGAWAQEYSSNSWTNGTVPQDTILPKIITHARQIGIGTANILDTYLSPEKYKGQEIDFVSQTTRERVGKKWSRQITHYADVSFLDNRTNNGSEIAGMYTFQYIWHYNWQLLGGRLTVKAGGGFDANLGFIYNTRNSNNPAQAKESLQFTTNGSTTYRFNIKRWLLAVRYELSVPLVGQMFSPNYGQSYYEIFSEGNYDHNNVITYFGNCPSMRQMLSLDLNLKQTNLRISYLGNVIQSHVNNLKYHSYNNVFMIGIVKKFKLINSMP